MIPPRSCLLWLFLCFVAGRWAVAVSSLSLTDRCSTPITIIQRALLVFMSQSALTPIRYCCFDSCVAGRWSMAVSSFGLLGVVVEAWVRLDPYNKRVDFTSWKPLLNDVRPNIREFESLNEASKVGMCNCIIIMGLSMVGAEQVLWWWRPSGSVSTARPLPQARGLHLMEAAPERRTSESLNL
jgi:hypothetical protein